MPENGKWKMENGKPANGGRALRVPFAGFPFSIFHFPFLLLATLAVVATFSACRRAPKDGGPSGDETVLQVGDRVITLREFFESFDRAKLERGIAGDPKASAALRTALVAEMIKRELILQYAKQKGITIKPDETAAEIARIRAHYPGDSFREMLAEQYVAYDEWVERQKVRLLVEKVVSEELESKIVVGEEEARAWFERHPEVAKEPERVRVRQILLSSEEEANLVRSRLARGEEFAELAREKSVSPEGKTGGDLGVFSPGQVPDGLEIVFTLPENVPSPVVQSAYGFHVFKVSEHTPARTLSFDETRDKVTESVRREKIEKAFPAWLEQISNGMKVSRNDAILAALE